MGEKKLPKFLTTGEFKQHVVNWSDDTIYRRIKSEGLPAQKDGRSYIFPTQEVFDWFKRRGAKAT
jgi:excisionase family DNA binding protein